MMEPNPVPLRFPTVEVSTESSLHDNDPNAPRMWQLWRPFVGIHRWYFSRGCPPPLRNLLRWEAALQISTLCAAMGLLAGIFTLFVALPLSLVPHQFSNLRFPLTGFVYGTLVFYPLSLWIGHSIPRSMGGVALCVLMWVGQFVLYQMIPSLHHELFGGGLRIFVVNAEYRILRNTLSFGIPAALLGIYFCGNDARKYRVLSAVLLAAAGYALGSEWIKAVGMGPRLGLTAGSIHHLIQRELVQTLPVIWYEIFLSMALGTLLWPTPDELEATIDRPSETTQSPDSQSLP